jgi:hypothetical protein
LAKLIYRTDFASRGYPASTDDYHLGPLHQTESTIPGVTAGGAMTHVASPPGAHLQVTRLVTDPATDEGGATKDDCYHGAVAENFPHYLHCFKIRATFELPEWDSNAPEYGWALVVIARRGDATVGTTSDDRVAVTLRSFKNATGTGAILNVPGGTALTPKVNLPPQLYSDIYKSHDPVRSTFTIELLIDQIDHQARAGLEAFSAVTGSFTQRYWFTHPLMATTPKVDAVGFVVAVARGQGTASAIIRDFSVYRLSWLEIVVTRIARMVDSLLGWNRG